MKPAPFASRLHPQHCHCWDCSDDPALRARPHRQPTPAKARSAARRDALTLTALAILAAAVTLTPLLAQPLP